MFVLLASLLEWTPAITISDQVSPCQSSIMQRTGMFPFLIETSTLLVHGK